MINERNAHKFCRDDISKIENYDKAIADTQVWDCHHRDEIRVLPSGMTVLLSRQYLIDNDRYYNCPANELIFLTHAEHQRLHNKGAHRSDETRKKISKSQKGKKGAHHSEDTRKKISESMKGRTISAETRNKLSESHKGKVPWNKGNHLSEEHRRKIAESLKLNKL